MKLLKTFAATCLVQSIPVLLVLVLVAPVVQSRAAAIARPNKNVPGMTPGRQGTHRPRTIWERMRDPKGWWQGRLVKSTPQGGRPRLRSSASGVSPFAGGAITNPIFFIPPSFGSGGRLARNIEVGDLNGDGKPDLLVSNECVSDADCTQSTIAVLLGNGDGTYQPALVSNTGAVLTSVTTGDFNRDGKLDVAVNNACSDVGCTNGSVNILLGNGDGTFQPPVAYSAGGSAFSVEAGDLNRDGKLDLVVVNGPQSAGVLLGNGDGTFQPVSTFTTSPAGDAAVFLGDFNGDSKLDLALVTGDCGSQCDTLISILLGNGDGTFQAPTGNQLFPSLNPQAVALGDANSDGKLDLAVAESCAPPTGTCVNESVTVLLGKGDGTFNAAKSSVLASNDVTFIGFGDLNGDSKADLVSVDPDAASATVLLGAGDGTFRLSGISYDTEGAGPLFGVLGDLNGDGKSDLAVANECQTNTPPCTGAVVALLGNGNGTLQAPANFLADSGVFLASSAADFNGDGKPDIVLADEIGAVDVLLNGANGNFKPPASYSSGGGFPSSVTVGDFNGDGKQDIAVLNQCASPQDCTHGVLGVLLGNGNGTFQSVVTGPVTGIGLVGLEVADFNGDGKLDLAFVSCCLDQTSGSVNVLLGNGDGSFRSQVVYSTGDPDARSVTVGDFNGDGKIDLAVANGNCVQPSPSDQSICATGSVGVLLGNGDGTFQAAVRYSSVDDYSIAVATGDFNGDGKLDLAVGNVKCEDVNGRCLIPGSISVLLGNGDGTFGAAVTYSSGNDAWPPLQGSNSIAASDLNGDGRLDLVLSGRDVLLGNGDGSFQAAQSYNPTGVQAHSEVVADFNGDGKPDLAVSEFGFVTTLLNISSGFHQATSTALTSSRNPVDFHHHVTFTATVTSRSQGAPTGTITFSDNGHALASVSVEDGKAKFRTSSLDAGVHSITASYSGDETFLPSTSPELDQVIQAETRTKLRSSHNPSRRGQAVTFTTVVVANSGETPTGRITFSDFSTMLATVQLSGGQATFTTSRLRKGHHVIRADYGGSSTDERSSTTFQQRVK